MEKQDGLLVFLSVKDRALYISTGAGLQHKLTREAIESILSEMKPFLRDKNYGGALEYCLLELEFLLKDIQLTTVSASSSSGGSGSRSNYRTHGETPWVQDFFRTFYGLIFFSYLLFSLLDEEEREEDKELKKIMKCKEDVDKIYEMDTQSCPICFHTYRNDTSSNVTASATVLGFNVWESGDSTKSTDDREIEHRDRILIKKCNHAFCDKCIKETVKTSAIAGTECLCCICGDSFDPEKDLINTTKEMNEDG